MKAEKPGRERTTERIKSMGLETFEKLPNPPPLTFISHFGFSDRRMTGVYEPVVIDAKESGQEKYLSVKAGDVTALRLTHRDFEGFDYFGCWIRSMSYGSYLQFRFKGSLLRRVTFRELQDLLGDQHKTPQGSSNEAQAFVNFYCESCVFDEVAFHQQKRSREDREVFATDNHSVGVRKQTKETKRVSPEGSQAFEEDEEGEENEWGYTQPEQWGYTQPEQGDDTQPEQGDDTQPEQGDDTQPEQGDDTQPEQGDDTQPEQGDDTQPEQGDDTQPEGRINEWGVEEYSKPTSMKVTEDIAPHLSPEGSAVTEDTTEIKVDAPEGHESKPRSNTPVIIGAAAGATLLLLGVGGFLLYRRRANRESQLVSNAFETKWYRMSSSALGETGNQSCELLE